MDSDHRAIIATNSPVVGHPEVIATAFVPDRLAFGQKVGADEFIPVKKKLSYRKHGVWKREMLQKGCLGARNPQSSTFQSIPAVLGRDSVNGPGRSGLFEDPSKLAAPQYVARFRASLDFHRISPFLRIFLPQSVACFRPIGKLQISCPTVRCQPSCSS
jgi:hypothetical protein